MPSPASERPRIALVGLAALVPGASDLDSAWAVATAGRTVSRRIDRPDVRPDRFGIPPIYRRSMPDLPLAILAVVETAFADAGFPSTEGPRDRADCVLGIAMGTGRVAQNTLRIEAPRFVDETLRALEAEGVLADATAAEATRRGLDREFGGGFNDKVYENAAALASQISVHLRLRGRTLAIEAADLTGHVAIATAMSGLHSGACDQAIVAGAQLLDGPLASIALAAKGFSGEVELGEAVVAAVLVRLEDARRDGLRVRAVLAGAGFAHASQRGPFRFGRDVGRRIEAIRRAAAQAGPGGHEIDYAECFASGPPDEHALEREALARGLEPAGTIVLGDGRERTGHAFAADGLVALARVVLALERKTFPPRLAPVDVPEPFRSPSSPEPWPEPRGDRPRRAAILASGLTGGHACLLVEDDAPAAAGRAHVAPPPRRKDEAVAIVGLSGRFGRTASPAAFWLEILAGRDALGPVPEAVLPRRLYYDPEGLDPLKSYTEIAAKVEVPAIDPGRFRIVRPRLAAMDEAQRLALVAAAEAAAGLSLPRGRTAVVIGAPFLLASERLAEVRVHLDETLRRLEDSPLLAPLDPDRRRRVVDRVAAGARERFPEIGPFTFDGYLASGIAAHVSNALDLDAVAHVVQAACASSIAAIDLARRGLLAGEWDAAIAGGVDLGVNLHDLVLCSRMRLLSPTRISPFDAGADGFSMGEGAALLVLTRLEDARRDGRPVRAVIRSIGSSCDARSMMAPDAEGQRLALHRAFEGVDFGPEAIDFLEAHGTGTEIGDRVEAGTIQAVYGTPRRERPLFLGSIKSMIGHAMAAAGAAGLLKTVLALEAGTIPPSANLERLDPGLGLDAIPAVVPTEARPWPRPAGAPRRAALSSFGTGGLNYHVILEEA